MVTDEEERIEKARVQIKKRVEEIVGKEKTPAVLDAVREILIELVRGNGHLRKTEQ